jgi:cytochrome c556
MKRLIIVPIGLLVGLVAFASDAPVAPPVAPPVAAVTSPENAVKYRHVEMEATGKHMKMAGMIARGEVGRPQDLARHATALHAASLALVALFPAGTGPDKVKSDSKAEIWTKPAEFAAAAKKYQDATAALVELANKGELAPVAAQLKVVGEACGACHDAFKVEDEH